MIIMIMNMTLMIMIMTVIKMIIIMPGQRGRMNRKLKLSVF